jgi:hypothetical protein
VTVAASSDAGSRWPREPEPGDEFVLDGADDTVAMWGRDDEVLWADGEGLMIFGPQGVGKSSIVQQLVLRRIGIRDDLLLGYPVEPLPRRGRVLYLAMDRPRQVRRSMQRMVTESNRQMLHKRFWVWQGPLPFNLISEPSMLAEFAMDFGADDVIIDSLKDLAPNLVSDEVGSSVNLAIQHLLAEGMNVVELHHPRKATSNNARPNQLDDSYGSGWLTAGLSSVVVLWGTAGARTVDLHHLKPPVTPCGPLRLVHDHQAGETRVEQAELDLLQHLQRAGSAGLSLKVAAQLLFGDCGKSSQQRARVRLKALVATGCARYTPGTKGGPGGGGTEAVWYAVEGGD